VTSAWQHFLFVPMHNPLKVQRLSEQQGIFRHSHGAGQTDITHPNIRVWLFFLLSEEINMAVFISVQNPILS